MDPEALWDLLVAAIGHTLHATKWARARENCQQLIATLTREVIVVAVTWTIVTSNTIQTNTRFNVRPWLIFFKYIYLFFT